jgi:peptidylprolyl isomerase
MPKQTKNIWITAAVIAAAALVLLALSFATGTRAPATQSAAQNPAAQPPAAGNPAAQAPPAPVAGAEGAITTPSGLRYIDRKVGDGPQPQATQSVVVHYEGFLEDGTKFDSSRDRGQPAEFPLNGVIPGFAEGLSSMKVGGVRTLLIPSALGYGASGAGGSIPPNANLRFEVELVAVK